jgi:hypothetical protein
MPALHRQLAGEDCRTTAVAVLADLQKITAFRSDNGVMTKSSNHQHIGPRDRRQQAAETAIGTGHGQVRNSFVAGRYKTV